MVGRGTTEIEGTGNVEGFLRDQQLLLDFVEKGVEILVDPEFEINQGGEKLSSRYMDATPAVDVMEYDSLQKGLAILLPKEKDMGCNVHRSKKSWATKQGKRKGRNVVNATVNGSKSGPYVPLNTPTVKEMRREK